MTNEQLTAAETAEAFLIETALHNQPEPNKAWRKAYKDACLALFKAGCANLATIPWLYKLYFNKLSIAEYNEIEAAYILAFQPYGHDRENMIKWYGDLKTKEAEEAVKPFKVLCLILKTIGKRNGWK